jgi:hypothetical protein
MKATVEALPWRDPNLITGRTFEILQSSLAFNEFADTAFDAALSVGIQPSAAGAFWLHRVLTSRSMASRDSFWCGYLHLKYEEHGTVEKLLRAAFKAEIDRISPEIIERWATLLLWFCAAADRRVRDRATKALVQITELSPALWRRLIERFVTVDDEFIVERCLAAAYGTLLRVRDKSAETAVAEVVFHEIFAAPARFQNAMIRDYARSILELTAYDQVLPEGITEADYTPPYQSDWPLDVPDADKIEKYRDSYQEMPRLHFSCMHDDFNTYTLNRLHAYENNIDKESMGRWIFQHVLDMGYTGNRFADYDGYMVFKYGGGRGKPVWAERIGKKYQWIALDRLAARLADHVTPEKDRWSPEPLRVPLSYVDGRDTDPSLLLQSSSAAKVPSWWFPETYDFASVAAMSEEEWTARHDDIPGTETMLAERIDSAGKHWVILEGYPEWSSEAPDMDWSGKYRLIWLHIRSYLISASDFNGCWKWLQKQRFMGDWMPKGIEFQDGFVGEYPWATTFNLYDDSYYLQSSEQTKLPCRMYPTCNSLRVSHKYDAYQEENIYFSLPARRFFEAEPLLWNRTNGYLSGDGVLRFLDPSIVEPGPSALLVDPSFLYKFLSDHGIVWTVLGEKLIVGDHENMRPPRLVYNRVYTLGPNRLRSSKPIAYND